MMAKQEQVNLTKSLAVANIFYFIYNSGKVCLLPFLSIYFRELGLSATQTGIVFGTKALVALVAVPMWSRCVRRFNKYKIVILASLFAMIASHLALMLVPPVRPGAMAMWCSNASGGKNFTNQGNVAAASNLQVAPTTAGMEETTYPPWRHQTDSTKLPGNSWKGNTATTSSDDRWSGQGQGSDHNQQWGQDRTESDDTWHGESRIPSHPIKQAESSTVPPRNNLHHGNVELNKNVQIQVETNTLIKNYRDIEQRSVQTEGGSGTVSTLTEVLTQKPEQLVTTENYFYQWLKNNSGALLDVLTDQKLEPHLSNVRRKSIEDENADEDIMLSVEDDSKDDTSSIFVAVLLLCIFGEIVSSPFERLLDNTFFGFLDDMDDTEKYGRQKLWSLLGYALWGVTICVIVESTACFLNLSINHFMIHFYGFAALMGLALLVLLFFPVQQSPSKEHGHNKLLKCLKLVYSDSHTVAYVISMFVAGLINASKFVFLFWLVMDLQGTEIPMGLALTVSTLSQIPMIHMQTWLTKQLTQVGVMTISLATLSIQFVYYSFLWTPWAVVPIEILSMFSIAGVLTLSMTYAEITAPPGLDRTMQLIFWTLYWQLGFAAGAFISGVTYSHLSSQTVFRSVSLLALVWAVAFLVIMKYAPRSKRRLSYSKLLQNSNDMEDDDDESEDEYTREIYTDDWLVNALKKESD